MDYGMRFGSLLFVLSCAVWGQNAAAPASFEVASIKPADPAASGSRTRGSPGRLTMSNMTLRQCILNAYRVQDYQLSGGPDWVNTQGYDIVAKVDDTVEKLTGDARSAQIQTMLRSLLADRFKLVLQHDTKVLPAYALTVAKSGLKIKEVEADGNTSSSTGRGRLTVSKVSMAQLATMLSGLVGRPVVDMTGVKGVFEFKLEYTSENQPSRKSDEPGSLDSAGPTIFTALQEQLGLRLEGQKAPVEMLLIEHVERPTEN